MTVAGAVNEPPPLYALLARFGQLGFSELEKNIERLKHPIVCDNISKTLDQLAKDLMAIDNLGSRFDPSEHLSVRFRAYPPTE